MPNFKFVKWKTFHVRILKFWIKLNKSSCGILFAHIEYNLQLNMNFSNILIRSSSYNLKLEMSSGMCIICSNIIVLFSIKSSVLLLKYPDLLFSAIVGSIISSRCRATSPLLEVALLLPILVMGKYVQYGAGICPLYATAHPLPGTSSATSLMVGSLH